MDRIHLEQAATRLTADTETPIGLCLKHPTALLLESAEVDGRMGRYSVLGTDFILRLDCDKGRLAVTTFDNRLAPLETFSGMDYLEGLRRVLDALEIVPPDGFGELPPITRALYGYLGYGITGLCVERLAKSLKPEAAEACLVLPGRLFLFDHLYDRLTELRLSNYQAPVAEPENREPRLTGPVESHPTREGFLRIVENIKEALKAGEGIQVVPSVHFQAPFEGNPLTLYRRLRRCNASPYLFYLPLPELTLLGSSPELNIRCQANNLQLSPIAGTRKRGQTDEADAALAAELLQDPKERAEHLMLVDLGRNDVGRIARPGSVKVERLMEVERFSHVMHLTSRVTGRLKPGLDPVDVIKATFPAGTVSGAPKVRAMEIIAEQEARPRGPYAGCIGWIGLDHQSVSLDLGITIRSLWIRNQTINWQAGAGIVFDSIPEKEFAECCNKSAIIRDVISGEPHVPAHR